MSHNRGNYSTSCVEAHFNQATVMGDRVKGFLQISEYNLHFSSVIQIGMSAERIAPLVDLPGKKPHCWSEMVTNSHSFSDICLSSTLLMIGKCEIGQ